MLSGILCLKSWYKPFPPSFYYLKIKLLLLFIPGRHLKRKRYYVFSRINLVMRILVSKVKFSAFSLTELIGWW